MQYPTIRAAITVALLCLLVAACDDGANDRLAACGDGILNPGEQCDDGNVFDSDGCLSTCVAARCGDTLVNRGAEECDGKNLDGGTCASLGYGGGSLGCAHNCRFDFSTCRPPATASPTSALPAPTATRAMEVSPTTTATRTSTINARPTATSIPTVVAAGSPTATPDASLCGNGRVEFDRGETCDDGNTVEGDMCPANCVIRSCRGSGSTMNAVVEVVPPGAVELSGLTVFVRYPDGVVRIPGVGNAASVQERLFDLPENAFFTPNDLDYGLRVVLFTPDASAIPSGKLLVIQFDNCIDAGRPPAAADFVCSVEDAADTSTQSVSGVTCSVAIP